MKTLTEIGRYYGTDKIDSHSYLPIYEMYLESSRHEKVRVLEIGYGGYEHIDQGGSGARMLREYFDHPESEVVVTDIYPKIPLPTDTFIFKQGSQTDEKFMTSLGSFLTIIDDGSHVCKDQIASFEIMFPLMPMGGIYIVEDTQTSFFKEYNQEGLPSATEYFKGLTDGLNHAEMRDRVTDKPNYFESNIYSIHFYHNLIIVMKGDNMERSNIVRNNW